LPNSTNSYLAFLAAGDFSDSEKILFAAAADAGKGETLTAVVPTD